MTRQTLESSQRTTSGRATNDKLKNVSADTFDSLVLQGEGPIVVEFMSYGCAHCGAMEPVLQQVAEKVKLEEKMFRVNVALDPELARNYAIEGTPTLIMFLGGKEVGRVEGPTPTLKSVLSAVTQPFEQ